MHAASARHRRLVNLGRALLIIGPTLAVSHILVDVLHDDTWWSYTVASYGSASIVTIIGAALTWRTPPRSVCNEGDPRPDGAEIAAM